MVGVRAVRREDQTLAFVYDGAPAPLLAALAAAEPEDIVIEEPSLEDVFLRYYTGEARR
jgi:ABC-2 type transport system ATP-binding protein